MAWNWFLHMITRWRQSTEYTSIHHLYVFEEHSQNKCQTQNHMQLFMEKQHETLPLQEEKVSGRYKGSDCNALYSMLKWLK